MNHEGKDRIITEGTIFIEILFSFYKASKSQIKSNNTHTQKTWHYLGKLLLTI